MRVEPAIVLTKVKGCMCDCDEDNELMLQLNGSACVARNVKNVLL